MTKLREVLADVLRIIDYASFGIEVSAEDGPPAEQYAVDADAVLAAIFALENREALREELVERGAVALVPDLWVWMGADKYVDYSEPSEPVYRFVPPDSSAGSGDAG